MLDSMLQVGSVWGQSAKPGEARWVARSSPAAAVHSCTIASGVASGWVQCKKVQSNLAASLLPVSIASVGCAARPWPRPTSHRTTEMREQRRRRPQRVLRHRIQLQRPPGSRLLHKPARRSLRRAVRRAPRTQHLMPLPYRSHACASGSRESAAPCDPRHTPSARARWHHPTQAFPCAAHTATHTP